MNARTLGTAYYQINTYTKSPTMDRHNPWCGDFVISGQKKKEKAVETFEGIITTWWPERGARGYGFVENRTGRSFWFPRESFAANPDLLRVGFACSFDVIEYRVRGERKTKAVNIRPADVPETSLRAVPKVSVIQKPKAHSPLPQANIGDVLAKDSPPLKLDISV
jgi:hypothetical protein